MQIQFTCITIKVRVTQIAMDEKKLLKEKGQ